MKNNPAFATLLRAVRDHRATMRPVRATVREADLRRGLLAGCISYRERHDLTGIRFLGLRATAHVGSRVTFEAP